MLSEHCAWEQRLRCASFLLTKLTRDYESQTNHCWERLHPIFILSGFSGFGITHFFAGTNKTHASSFQDYTIGPDSLVTAICRAPLYSMELLQGRWPTDLNSTFSHQSNPRTLKELGLQIIPLKWLGQPFIPAQCLSGSYNVFHLYNFNGYMLFFFSLTFFLAFFFSLDVF